MSQKGNPIQPKFRSLKLGVELNSFILKICNIALNGFRVPLGFYSTPIYHLRTLRQSNINNHKILYSSNRQMQLGR
jgi:hypothetical protein